MKIGVCNCFIHACLDYDRHFLAYDIYAPLCVLSTQRHKVQTPTKSIVKVNDEDIVKNGLEKCLEYVIFSLNFLSMFNLFY